MDVQPSAGACESVREIAGLMSSALKEAELETNSACYLPNSPDGEIVMGAVSAVKGLYIASGHSCWGILNSPATGLLLSGKS